MSEEPKKRRCIGWTAVLGVILLLAGFVGSYFAISTIESPDPADPTVYRHFQSRFACRVYYPIGWLEAKIRGTPVVHLRPASDFDQPKNSRIAASWVSVGVFDP